MRVLSAGVALSLVAGIAWWRGGEDAAQVVASAPRGSNARATLTIPAGATREMPRSFAFDAAIARNAVRDGALHVSLPDGADYAVAIERNYTDANGNWHVVGRTKTRLGPQAMVMTFRGAAVFGVLPTPDGGLLHVVTGPRNRVTIAPAGDLVPAAATSRDTDVRIPPRRKTEITRVSTAARTASAAQKFRADGTTQPRTAPIARSAIASQAPIDTTPVRIDVIALYSQDLITARGSVANAEAEVANLFAIANQAHRDSGARITLNPVRVQLLSTVPAVTQNGPVLDALTNQQYGDIEAIRDNYAGDLVTLVRPYQDGDPSCGVAWLTGEGMHRNAGGSPTYGYSVVNVGGCSPYVLAHELGHLMGSMHDRQTSRDPETGNLDYGAYAFSFGYRNDAFATVMAYPQGMPRIGYFSNPGSTACGSPCGIEEASDNVRSLNLMAPMIAGFRGTKGTVSISDVEAVELRASHELELYVPVLLSGPAPAEGATFEVQVIGGTATQGVDYRMPADASTYLSPGWRSGGVPIVLIGDDEIEPDETILLRLVARAGTNVPIADATATLTIVADDPRPMITGRLWFPLGIDSAGLNPTLKVYGVDGTDEGDYWETLWPNADQTFAIPVAYGSELRIENYPSTAWGAMKPALVQEVHGDRALPLMFLDTYALSGQIKFAPGSTPPTTRRVMSVHAWSHGVEVASDIVLVQPPEFRYITRVPVGSTLEMTISAGDSWKPYVAYLQDFAPRDQIFDPVLSNLPTIFATGPDTVPEGTTSFPIYVELSEPAGAQGVNFRWRTLDGTAKAGTHYVAGTGQGRIQPGAEYATITLALPPGNTRPDPARYFDFVVDQVTGATASTATKRTWIGDDDRRTGGPGAKSAQ
ncbi:putative secreted protein [Lysobacter dokdonensis DS-58]|uniref:Putative secreted protein n=1 Tax=Lysobacter dokdonensis DS-58 TaxID=1300345 RepID=A0A0A2WIS4_9GAMM|nr:M12 family metallo-peptidase [Lysobacter dokdonensis]KGQ18617.1 putative secreted protein [Lysobacter dokdonensis DS-58]